MWEGLPSLGWGAVGEAKDGAEVLAWVNDPKAPEAKGRAEEPVGLLPLVSPEGRPRELTARFAGLPPGRYAAEPDIPEWAEHLRGPAGKLRSTFEVVPPDADETADLSANLPLLEELAAASGGRVYDVTNAGELARDLASRAAVREFESAAPLRRSWWTLALVTLLLTTEWVVRRWSGLA